MTKNIETLLRLVQENPDLPVVPMVEGSIAWDDSGYFMAAFGAAEVDEYIVSRQDDRIYFKSDDDVFDVLEHVLSDEEFNALPQTEAECRPYFEALERMSCVPAGIRKVRADHIFDEERSVRWNREMVEKNNADYQAEVARLNTEKNKRRDAILEDIYRLIQEDVGHDLSRVKAQRLWAYAWELGHANGFPDVYCHLQDAIELARMLLE